MSLPIFKFKFKQVEKPKTKHKVKKSKYLHCVCIKEDDGFYAHINISDNDEDNKEYANLVIPFTKESYSLKGKTKIFSIKPDKDGRILTILRDKTLSILHPGLDTIYTPMRDKFVYGGHVIEIDKKHYFDVVDCFTNMNVFYKNEAK